MINLTRINTKDQKQVLQEKINMDRYIVSKDIIPKSYEEVMFIGTDEECKQWIIDHTRRTDFVISDTF